MSQLHCLPAFQDNCIWMLEDGTHALVVDPGDVQPVRAALARGLRLAAVLLTHHHLDHIGGAAELLAEHPASCYAPVDSRIPLECTRVGEGERVEVPELGLAFEVMEIPGHTLTHIAFVGADLLFCGDTLFSLGCGRLFEGSPEQMLHSLDRLAALPDATQVCCGHEYTAANGRFALQVDPTNKALAERNDEVARLRAADRPSLPSRIDRERAGNPFLRIDTPGVRAGIATHLGGRAPAGRIEAFAALRRWKDGFTG